jgi:hypothetical protein
MISAIAAGVSIGDYETMDILEIAYTIVGNQERLYNKLTYQRYMAWVQMKPHIKENTLKAPEELFALPTDKKAKVTTNADLEKMQNDWKKADAKKWRTIDKVL